MGTGNPKKNFLISLSSKGLCFVCLRDIADVDLDQCTVRDARESRLWNITHFLGINQKKILQSHFTCELSKCEGVQVKLCQACSELMEKFDSLYKSLELTRLQMNDCLRRIHTLIDEAGRDNGRLEEVKRRVTHAPTAGVLDDMRRKVLEKSFQAFDVALPRVVLERVVAPVKVPIKDEESVPDSEETHEPEESIGAELNLIPEEEPSDDDDQVSLPEPEAPKSFEVALPRVVLERVVAPVKVPIKDKASRPDNEETHEPEENIELNLVPEQEASDDDQVSLPEAPESSLRSMRRRRRRRQVSYTKVRKPRKLKRKVKGGNGRRTQNITQWKVTCPHCGVRCRSESHLLKHNVGFHCHHVFTDKHRLPSVTPEQFENIVSNALFESMIKKKGDLGLCAVCSQQHECDHGNYFPLRMHLVQRHYQDLVKKLMELQADPDILNKLPLEKAKEEAVSSSSEFGCPHCLAAPRTQEHLNRHLVNQHLETLFAPEEKFKDTSLTSHQYKQTIHHLLFHESYIGRQVERKKCPECARPFNGSNCVPYLKVHMIQKHYAALTRRLKNLQKDPKIQQKLDGGISTAAICECGAYFVSMLANHQHRTKFCKLLKDEGEAEVNPSLSHSSSKDNEKSSREKACPHCRAEFVNGSYDIATRFDSHLLCHHLDTYFLPEEEFKEPSLSSHQFKQVLGHFLFDNIRKVDGPQKCPHCPRIYKVFNRNGNPNLKLHLVSYHRKELAQRLRELQKDPRVLNKVKRAKGFPCKCGAYYVTMRGRTAHQRKFCNLLSGTTSRRTTSEEGTTEASETNPDDSTGLEVDDDDREDERSLFITLDSESGLGRDPLSLKPESGQFDEEQEQEPEERNSEDFEIDVEEFVYVAKVEEEPNVKIERKREGVAFDSESPTPKVSKTMGPSES